MSTGIPSHGKSNFVEWYVMNLMRDYGMKASFFSPEHHPMELHQTTLLRSFTGRTSSWIALTHVSVVMRFKDTRSGHKKTLPHIT